MMIKRSFKMATLNLKGLYLVPVFEFGCQFQGNVSLINLRCMNRLIVLAWGVGLAPMGYC